MFTKYGVIENITIETFLNSLVPQLLEVFCFDEVVIIPLHSKTYRNRNEGGTSPPPPPPPTVNAWSRVSNEIIHNSEYSIKHSLNALVVNGQVNIQEALLTHYCCCVNNVISFYVFEPPIVPYVLRDMVESNPSTSQTNDVPLYERNIYNVFSYVFFPSVRPQARTESRTEARPQERHERRRVRIQRNFRINECYVCMELRILNNHYGCSHQICSICFQEWNTSCPICRCGPPIAQYVRSP